MANHRALVGIDYPPNKRVEAGDTVTDLPGDAVKWLLADGLIEVAKAGTPASDPLPRFDSVVTVVVSAIGDTVVAEVVPVDQSSSPEPTPAPDSEAGA